jgi:hypothetical protein
MVDMFEWCWQVSWTSPLLTQSHKCGSMTGRHDSHACNHYRLGGRGEKSEIRNKLPSVFKVLQLCRKWLFHTHCVILKESLMRNATTTRHADCCYNLPCGMPPQPAMQIAVTTRHVNYTTTCHGDAVTNRYADYHHNPCN